MQLLDSKSLESYINNFICSANIYYTARITQNKLIHKESRPFYSRNYILIGKIEGQEKHRKKQKPVFASIFRIRNNHTKAQGFRAKGIRFSVLTPFFMG